ncbi:MAG: aspartyl protease family protein [Myxococcota bacterium]
MLGLVAAACGGSDLSYTGSTGQPIAATVAGNVFIVPAEVGSATGLSLIVDTGAPAVAIRAPAAPDAIRANAINTVPSVKTLGLSISSLRVVGLDFFGDAVALDGLLGCDVLCAFDLDLDYRAQKVVLDGPAPTDGVEAEVKIPFELKGGGLEVFSGISEAVALKASRIVVPVELEGVTRHLIVDSGAAYPIVRSSIGSGLVADGRKVLDANALAMGGVTTTHTGRTKSLSVGGAAVTNIPIAWGDALDTLIDGAQQETDTSIDGLIGGSYLRSFYVSIGYSDRTLRLWRYTAQDHVVDEMQRVGIDLSTARTESAAGRRITFVHAGTDAAKKGLAPGDTLHAIDGVSVDQIHPLALLTKLAGAAGSTHDLTLDCAACGVIGGKLTVGVDDLIPLVP